MEIKDLRDDELKKVNDMYEKNKYWLDCDSLDFITNYLERCECCKEVVFKEDLQEKKMWDGSKCMCCIDCQQVADEWNRR